jgi:hypothetical protein
MMKNIKRYLMILIGLTLLVGLGACGKSNKTDMNSAMSTAVQETITMGETRTAIARPSDTPIPSPTMMPTIPPIEPTSPQPTFDMTAIYGITQSPPPAATNPVATPTTMAGEADRGDWGRSVPADGTLIDGGTTFKVQVTIVNTGTTTWNTGYYIKHVSGPDMGVTKKFNMPTSVAPGLSVTFEIEFTAPVMIGTVKSDWAIFNQNNVAIGYFYFEYEID